MKPFDNGLREARLPEHARYWDGGISDAVLHERELSHTIAEHPKGFLVVDSDVWNITIRMRMAKTPEEAAFLLDQYLRDCYAASPR